jgi:hypothetical protein
MVFSDTRGNVLPQKRHLSISSLSGITSRKTHLRFVEGDVRPIVQARQSVRQVAPPLTMTRGDADDASGGMTGHEEPSASQSTSLTPDNTADASAPSTLAVSNGEPVWLAENQVSVPNTVTSSPFRPHTDYTVGNNSAPPIQTNQGGSASNAPEPVPPVTPIQLNPGNPGEPAVNNIFQTANPKVYTDGNAPVTRFSSR